MEDGSNIIQFPRLFEEYTTEKIPPSRVINAAQEHLDTVVLIGWDKNGEEYFASSTPNVMEVIWLIERLKHTLLSHEVERSE